MRLSAGLGLADSERKRLLYAPRLDWRNLAIEEYLRSGTQDRVKAYKDVRIVVVLELVFTSTTDLRFEVRSIRSKCLVV